MGHASFMLPLGHYLNARNWLCQRVVNTSLGSAERVVVPSGKLPVLRRFREQKNRAFGEGGGKPHFSISHTTLSQHILQIISNYPGLFINCRHAKKKTMLERQLREYICRPADWTLCWTAFARQWTKPCAEVHLPAAGGQKKKLNEPGEPKK